MLILGPLQNRENDKIYRKLLELKHQLLKVTTALVDI
jgi:hypothetical protein